MTWTNEKAIFIWKACLFYKAIPVPLNVEIVLQQSWHIHFNWSRHFGLFYMRRNEHWIEYYINSLDPLFSSLLIHVCAIFEEGIASRGADVHQHGETYHPWIMLIWIVCSFLYYNILRNLHVHSGLFENWQAALHLSIWHVMHKKVTLTILAQWMKQLNFSIGCFEWIEAASFGDFVECTTWCCEWHISVQEQQKSCIALHK